MVESSPYRIAFQGAAGAFSHLAAQKFASSFLNSAKLEFVPKSSFEEAFEFAEHEENALSCIPFENSTVGSIIQNYQLLWATNLHTYSEYTLQIHHQLMALPGTRMEDVIEVYSHPVALDQCKKIFKEHGWMHPHIYFDTGASAKMIKDEKKRNAAAIAAKQAAEEYGLEIIAPDIEDYAHNQTRFALLGKKNLKLSSDTVAAPFKFTVAFEGQENLNKITEFSQFLGDGCDLIKLEPLPVPERPFQFRVFLDFRIANEKGRKHANDMETSVQGIKTFGKYNAIS